MTKAEFHDVLLERLEPSRSVTVPQPIPASIPIAEPGVREARMRRATECPAYGPGLSIARASVEAMGGTIRAEDISGAVSIGKSNPSP
jgi:hypothetical protein